MPENGMPVASQEEAVRELERLQAAERHGHRAGLAGARELRWLAGVCVLLLVPVFAAPFALSAYHALLVCYYGAIVGFVVAGWGIWRSLGDSRTHRPVFRAAAWVWAIYFLLFFLLYGYCLLSPKLEKPWKITDRFSGGTSAPMRRK